MTHILHQIPYTLAFLITLLYISRPLHHVNHCFTCLEVSHDLPSKYFPWPVRYLMTSFTSHYYYDSFHDIITIWSFIFYITYYPIHLLHDPLCLAWYPILYSYPIILYVLHNTLHYTFTSWLFFRLIWYPTPTYIPWLSYFTLPLMTFTCQTLLYPYLYTV